ncbi:MAG TPA: restriction endonuclease [Verrucomicrobiae bacterium]|jgi:hypothetical protein|nr:restriction endonuclease [Verrucomicrobiae bacterium]
MLLAKRHDIGLEILQGSAFAFLVGCIYHYFGPSSSTPPSPEVCAVLAAGVLLTVSVGRQFAAKTSTPSAADTLSQREEAELVEKLRGADWLQLEKVVSEIYVQLGCATWRQANSEGENNFSLVIERGSHKAAVMCKPWKNAEIASPEIIEFSTELKRAGMSHGVLVSLRQGTLPALQVAEALGIEIVNETGLLQLMAGCGERLRGECLAILESDAKYCPSCDHQMLLRTATKGLGAGEQFWGCSTYPKCRCSVPH